MLANYLYMNKLQVTDVTILYFQLALPELSIQDCFLK
jgi:hypothetical protein